MEYKEVVALWSFFLVVAGGLIWLATGNFELAALILLLAIWIIVIVGEAAA